VSENPVVHSDITIVGAGFAGLGLALELAGSGADFTILERASSVGGTWRDNVYPGVACDIPAHLYSLAAFPNPQWSGVFAPGAEIRAYLERLGQRFGDELELNTALLDARWDDDRMLWQLDTSTGPRTSRILVLACGRLAEPFVPAIPGLTTFPGELFHSARWRPDVDLAGKRVAVVGSGASAVQLLPHVADVAAEVVLFQRSAPYVIPREERAYSEAERALFERDGGEISRLRDRLFWDAEEAFAQRSGDPERTEAARTRALDHLHAQVRDEALRRQLTPAYEVGCKRVLISNDFYPALTRDSVSLEPSPIVAIDGSVASGASGAAHEVDVIIFATGFHTAEQPYAHAVHGRTGSLAEHWAGGMRAYASTAVAGFPNMFVLDGPNAGLGHNSAVHMIESQIAFVRDALSRDGVLEVGQSAEDEWTAMIDDRAAGTVWTSGGCESWYVDPRNGRLTLLWPGFAHEFRARLRDAASVFDITTHSA
jgi:cation diffusion facilitator CzcD-associated flavoprotein CzcO